jgi:hypothetical protein
MNLTAIVQKIAAFPKIITDNKLASSLNRIIKNRGVWLSPQQYRFFMAMVNKGKFESEFVNQANLDQALRQNDVPGNCFGIVLADEVAYYLDTDGVASAWSTNSKRNNNVSSPIFLNLTPKFRRKTDDINQQLQENEAWFGQNRSLIKLVIRLLRGHPVYDKYVQTLSQGKRISDKILLEMQDAITKIQEGNRTEFPRKYEGELVLTVGRIKSHPLESITLSRKITLIGDVDGYVEKGYFAFDFDSLARLLGINLGAAKFDAQVVVQEFNDMLVGSRVTVEGRFIKSNNLIIALPNQIKLVSLS